MHALEQGPEVCTSPSLPRHYCLHNHLQFCSSLFCLCSFTFGFLREVCASKAEWTVPSSLMRWSEHPVDMANVLWSTLAHCTQPQPLPLPEQAFNHLCIWRWCFHRYMVASVVSPTWLQREKILWCLNPREGFRPQMPVGDAWGFWVGNTRCNRKDWHYCHHLQSQERLHLNVTSHSVYILHLKGQDLQKFCGGTSLANYRHEKEDYM